MSNFFSGKILAILGLIVLLTGSGCLRYGVKEEVGTSVRSKPISLYRFGPPGVPAILFHGGIHGNEWQAVSVTQKLIELLEDDSSLTENVQVLVIPNVNPDGIDRRQRFNLNGVDINRNFGTRNWQSATRWKGKTFPKGGGKAAFSEPEARSLSRIIDRYGKQIKLVVSIHCCGNLALSDGKTEVSDAVSAAMRSAKKFRPPPKRSFSKTFYPVTGSFAQWLWEKHRIPHVLLELEKDLAGDFGSRRPVFEKAIARFSDSSNNGSPAAEAPATK